MVQCPSDKRPAPLKPARPIARPLTFLHPGRGISSLSETTLAIGILLDLLTAVMFGYVGLRVDALRGDSTGAVHYSLWFWYGAMGFMVLDGGFALLVILGVMGPEWALPVLFVRRLLFTQGLLAFIRLLWTMDGTFHPRIWQSYRIVMLSAVATITLFQLPDRYEILPWNVAILPTRTTPQWVDLSFGCMLFIPVALAALRLLRWHGGSDFHTKFRLHALVWSTISFCAMVLYGFWDNQWFWYGLLENRVAFSAALGMLFVLRPPWFARWFWHTPRITHVARLPGAPLVAEGPPGGR